MVRSPLSLLDELGAGSDARGPAFCGKLAGDRHPAPPGLAEDRDFVRAIQAERKEMDPRRRRPHPLPHGAGRDRRGRRGEYIRRETLAF
jgi:hypothetical protein